MLLEFWIAMGLRITFLLGAALLAAASLRRASASLRRCVLLLGLGASCSVPALGWSLSGRAAVHVSTPVTARVVAEALTRPLSASSRISGSPARASEPGRGRSASSWLFVVWALGAGTLALRLGAAHLRSRGVVRRAESSNGLCYSGEIASPVVIGVLAPVVVLPLAAKGWSAERLRVVLLHESAHVRRRDGLALLVAHVARALYWVQPLAWLAARQLRRECELAADEDVVSAGLRATSYAEHLLAIARDARTPSVGLAMAGRPSELGQRIAVLVSRSRLPAPLTRGRFAAVSGCALVLLVSVACTGGVDSAAAPVRGTARSATPLDASLQAIASDEAERVHREWGAQRVSILVLDPRSGRVLAQTDDAPELPVVPASTLKPLTLAIALDSGSITAEQRFDCGNGARSYGPELTLRDAGQYGALDAAEILAVSSNVGVSRIFDVLGSARLSSGLNRFGIGAPASIPDGTLRGALVAIGEGSTTSPAALAAAYGVFANDGVLVRGSRSERVIQSSTASTVRSMLEGVVTGERATGTAARVPGVRIGGKTGTSDDPDCEACAHTSGTFATFIGIVPLDEPRWVIYVGVGQPSREGSGGTIAAPAFARIATRALGLATPH